MRTIEQIRKGNYCDECSTECKHFAEDADCCVVDTFIGCLHSKVIDGDDSQRIMKFEPKSKDELIVSIVGDQSVIPIIDIDINKKFDDTINDV